MEASRFGFGWDMPPAFKFDPTDADLVASYLLPRALGLHNPHAHAIIEEDPGNVPPWEILARHGHVANNDHPVQAFFFGRPADASHNGGRRSRTVQGGGVWQGQKGAEKTVTLLRPGGGGGGGGGGGEVDIRYKMYHLTFCRTKNGPSTGYVMHELEILSPPLPGTVLTRIKAKKGAYRPPGGADGADEQHAVIQVPDPSYSAGAQDGALYDNLGYDLPVVQYDGSYSYSIQDQPGTSYNYNAAAMMNGGGGFTGAQANAFYGGEAVETAGAYYDPSNSECGAEYSNCYREYQYHQQWQYQQQDTSNQYQAGDGAVMYAGSGGFIAEQQTGAPCSNGDNDSPVGTDASAHSTISLCGDQGEAEECDDTTFYNTLLGTGDDIKREQNDAGR